MKTMDILDVSDARGLLDLLARRRVIDWEEKRILDATLIEGKTLKDVSQRESTNGSSLGAEMR